MRTPLAIIFVLFAFVWSKAEAADRITATISVTNAPIGNTNKITINSDTRSFTNSVTGSPGTLIQETNSIPWTATNLLAQLTTYRVSQFHFLGSSASTNVRITGAVGEALTVTLAGGWGFVTYTTQTVASPTFVVRVPLTVEQTSNRTHIASLLVTGMSDNSTNAFATNSTALSNHITKGASPPQSITSELRLSGNLNNGANSLSVSNLANFGNAIRSFGSGGNSFQAGSNATATASRSVALGNSSVASGTDSLAAGTSAQATNANATAVGVSTIAAQNSTALGTTAVAEGVSSTSIGASSQATRAGSSAIGNLTQATGAGSFAGGQGAAATADYAIAIGNEDTDASGTNGVAIGLAAQASAYRTTALGAGSVAQNDFSTALGGYDNTGAATTTTETNQVRIGTGAHTVSIPGNLEINGKVQVGTLTNSTLRGINVINGRIDFTSRANTALANGYNSGTVLGTNVYIKLSGPTAAHTNVGFAAAVEGTWHKVQVDNPGLSYTVLNESGLEATPANRILTGTGALVNSTNNPVQIEVIYDATAARWRLLQIR